MARPKEAEREMLGITRLEELGDSEGVAPGDVVLTTIYVRALDAPGTEPVLAEATVKHLRPREADPWQVDTDAFAAELGASRDDARRRCDLYDSAALACERLGLRPPGRALPEGWLELVGRIWSGFAAAQVPDPIVRMTTLSGVSRPAVRSWVSAARQAGYLNPFEGDGVELEDIDSWHLELLKELGDSWESDPRAVSQGAYGKLQRELTEFTAELDARLERARKAREK